MTTSKLLLLDTHVWVRYQSLSRPLRAEAEEAIEEAAARSAIYVSIISIWELALLQRDGRLNLNGGVERWCSEALDKPGINLLPLSPSIAIEAVNLPERMHKDPADRILVGSARIEGMTLITADKLILTFARSTGLSTLRA